MVRVNLALRDLPNPLPPVTDVWNALNSLCLKNLPPSECASLIGTNPLYIPQSACKKGLPWWAYMAIGFVIANNI